MFRRITALVVAFLLLTLAVPSVFATADALLPAPTLSINGDVLTIQHSSAQITKYAVYIDDEEVTKVIRDSVATQVDLSSLDLSDYEFEDGSHAVTVFGCTDVARQTETSAAVTWTISSSSGSSSSPTAPTLAINGDILTIVHSSSDVPTYAIFLHEDADTSHLITTVSRTGMATQVDLSKIDLSDLELANGNYSITVCGVSGQTRLTEESDAVSWRLGPSLHAPTLSRSRNSLVISHGSEEVEYYRIFVDGVQKATVFRSGVEMQYALSKLGLADGTYSVTVCGCFGEATVTEASAAFSWIAYSKQADISDEYGWPWNSADGDGWKVTDIPDAWDDGAVGSVTFETTWSDVGRWSGKTVTVDVPATSMVAYGSPAVSFPAWSHYSITPILSYTMTYTLSGRTYSVKIPCTYSETIRYYASTDSGKTWNCTSTNSLSDISSLSVIAGGRVSDVTSDTLDDLNGFTVSYTLDPVTISPPSDATDVTYNYTLDFKLTLSCMLSEGLVSVLSDWPAEAFPLTPSGGSSGSNFDSSTFTPSDFVDDILASKDPGIMAIFHAVSTVMSWQMVQAMLTIVLALAVVKFVLLGGGGAGV